MKKLSDKKKKHLKNHSQKQLRKKIKRKSKKYTGTAVSLVPIQSRFPAKPATVYFEDIRVPLNFNLSIPPLVACCSAKLNFCIRYTITFEDCTVCDKMVCYDYSIVGCQKK